MLNLSPVLFSSFLVLFSTPPLSWLFCTSPLQTEQPISSLFFLVLHSPPSAALFSFHIQSAIASHSAIASSIFTILPLINGSYGHTTFWCWISSNAPGLQFGVWYGPMTLCIVCTMVVYIYMGYRVYLDTQPGSVE